MTTVDYIGMHFFWGIDFFESDNLNKEDFCFVTFSTERGVRRMSHPDSLPKSSSQTQAGHKIAAFCVFNPTISQKEDTAHQNIFCYYPTSTPLNNQMNDVGMCIAMSGMIDRFGPSNKRPKSDKDGVCSITTARRRISLCEVEPNFWVMIVTTRSISSVPAASDDYDEKVTSLITQHVRLVHAMFCMMHGSFTYNYQHPHSDLDPPMPKEERLACLQHLLQGAFAIRLRESVERALELQLGTLGTPVGLEYLSVDKYSYMVLSSLVTLIQAAHPGAVRNLVVTYQGKIAFSGLSLAHTVTLYHILAEDNAAPDEGKEIAATRKSMASINSTRRDRTAAARLSAMAQSLQGMLRPSNATFVGFVHQQPPPTLSKYSFRDPSGGSRESEGTSSAGSSIPIFFLNDEAVAVLTYCVLGFRLYIIVAPKYVEHAELLAGLSEGITHIMSTDGIPKLKSVIVPAVQLSKDLDWRFIYFYSNNTNMAVKTSAPQKTDSDEKELVQILEILRHGLALKGRRDPPPDSQDLPIHQGMDVVESPQLASQGSTIDILLRVRPSLWAYAITSEDREFYVAVEATTIDQAMEEVHFICDYVFTGIFMECYS